jgi:Lhr-like helicase
MTTKRKTQKQPNKTAVRAMPEFIADENHKTIYSNIVQVLHGVYDFQLTFGLVEGLQKGKMSVKALQTVVISPQHAKQLALLLAENVAKYERHYMAIPIFDEEMLEKRIVAEEKEDEEAEAAIIKQLAS